MYFVSQNLKLNKLKKNRYLNTKKDCQSSDHPNKLLRKIPDTYDTYEHFCV